MNDVPHPSRLQQLFERARAHRAPPELWPAIAARAAIGPRRRPWSAAAALLAGALAYLGLAALRPPATAADAELVPIVAAAMPKSVDRAEPIAADLRLLQQLAAAPAVRSR